MTFKELKDHLEIINRYGVEALTVSTSDLTELVQDIEETLTELNEAIAQDAGQEQYMEDSSPEENGDYLWHLSLMECGDGPYVLNS